MPAMLGQQGAYGNLVPEAVLEKRASEARRSSQKKRTSPKGTSPKGSTMGPAPQGGAVFGVYLPRVEPIYHPSFFEDMFGPVLQTKTYVSERDEKCDGKMTNEVLHRKKAVLIYFTAQYVPATRDFGPQLMEAYNDYNPGDVEVVFISDDHNQDAFAASYDQMPWTAVPWANQRIRQRLVTQFGPQTFPLLVVVDSDGNVVTDKGCRDLRDLGSLDKALECWDLSDTERRISLLSETTCSSLPSSRSGRSWRSGRSE